MIGGPALELPDPLPPVYAMPELVRLVEPGPEVDPALLGLPRSAPMSRALAATASRRQRFSARSRWNLAAFVLGGALAASVWLRLVDRHG